MDTPAELTQQFVRDGYIVLEGLVSDEDCNILRSRSQHYIDELDMASHPKSVFSTQHQKNDEYFMESQDKIRFFFEENVFDENGQLNRDKSIAVNKVGHGLHLLDDDYKKATFSPKIEALAKSLDFIDPVIVQSMVIFKQPGIGGAVTPHQDGTFLITRPSKVVGVWIALEDADVENGCLWFIPGSHNEPTSRKMIRNVSGESPVTIFTSPPDEYDDSKFIAVPIKKGSGIVIHGHVVHKSEKNLSSRTREIYTFHIAESHNTEWSAENWLQPTEAYSFPNLYTS